MDIYQPFDCYFLSAMELFPNYSIKHKRQDHRMDRAYLGWKGEPAWLTKEYFLEMFDTVAMHCAGLDHRFGQSVRLDCILLSPKSCNPL